MLEPEESEQPEKLPTGVMNILDGITKDIKHHQQRTSNKKVNLDKFDKDAINQQLRDI